MYYEVFQDFLEPHVKVFKHPTCSCSTRPPPFSLSSLLRDDHGQEGHQEVEEGESRR